MTKVKLEVDVEPTQIDALRVYLGRKNTSLEVEIAKHIDTLYAKNVPNVVREFLSANLDNKKNEGRPEAINDR